MFNWFDNQDVIKKVQFGIGFISLLIAIIISLSIWKIFSINTISSQVVELRIPTSQNSLKMLNGVNHSLAALRGWMILGQEKFKDEREYAWKNEIIPSLNQMSLLLQNWTNPENVKRLSRITASLEKFKGYQKEIESIAFSIDNLPANKIFLLQAVPASSQMLNALTIMIDAELALPSTSKRKHLLGVMVNLRASTVKSLALIRADLFHDDKKIRTNYAHNWIQNSKSVDSLFEMQSFLSLKQKRSFENFLSVRDTFIPLVSQMFTIRSSEKWNLANYWLATKAAPMGFKIKDDLEFIVNNQEHLQKKILKNHKI
mgnify:CR=1 FL=1|jgi:methyl-accepting chemotaxis protein